MRTRLAGGQNRHEEKELGQLLGHADPDQVAGLLTAEGLVGDDQDRTHRPHPRDSVRASANGTSNATRLLEEGDPAPGGGILTGNIGAPSINNRDDVAFFGQIDSGLVGIFVALPNGAVDRVIDTAASVPNHPGTPFDGFGRINLMDDGSVVFQGFYSLEGQLFSGLYRTSGGRLQVLIDQADGLEVDGQPTDLVDESGSVLPMFLAPRFAALVDGRPLAAFGQQLPVGQGIFIAG